MGLNLDMRRGLPDSRGGNYFREQEKEKKSSKGKQTSSGAEKTSAPTQPKQTQTGFSQRSDPTGKHTLQKTDSGNSRGSGFHKEVVESTTVEDKSSTQKSGFSSGERRGGGFSTQPQTAVDISRGGGFFSGDSSGNYGFRTENATPRGGGFSSATGYGFDKTATTTPRNGGFSRPVSQVSRAGENALGNVQAGAANVTEIFRFLYEAGQPSRTTREEEQRREIENNLARAQRDMEILQQDNAPAADRISQQNIIDYWQRQLDAFSTVLDGQVQQKATQATSRLSDQMYEQGLRQMEDAYRGADPFEVGFLRAEEAAIRGAQRGLANAVLPGGAAAWQTVQNFGTGIRESRQAGGDLGEQLQAGLKAAYPLQKKYWAVLGDTGGKAEELTPFLRGFLDEEPKLSKPTGEKDAFSLGFEGEEPKTSKPAAEVEKDPFLIGFEGEDSSEVSANYYSEPETDDKKEVDPYSNIHYHEDGTVVVTDDWKPQGKKTLPSRYNPNAVVETSTLYKDGHKQVDRSFYDADGWLVYQIHSGNHNKPHTHKFGADGSEAFHKHLFYRTETGIKRDPKMYELTEAEKIANRDILNGGKS